MDLQFSPHALMRMRRRQIPEEAVYHVVLNYDRRVDHADRVEYFGVWDDRQLHVVIAWQNWDETRGRVVTVIERETRRRMRR